MAIPLKQSTASQEVPIGPFLDDGDGKTAETGLTIANTDIQIWKHGGTTESSKNSGGATHIAAGRYYMVLDATDTDTLGGLVASVHVAGALPCRVECVVLPANVYDSLIAGSDRLVVDVEEIGNNIITAASLASDAGAEIADAVWDEALSGHTTAGSAGKQLQDISTGTAPTVGAIADAVWDEALSGHLGAGTTGEALDAAATASGGSGSPAPPTLEEIIEGILTQDLSGFTEGSVSKRSLFAAIAKLVNKVAASGGTLTVYQTDGSTPLYTQTETTDAAADPLTGLTGAS